MSKLTPDTMSEVSKANANACFLLSRLWSHEVELAELTDLVSGSVGAAYREAGGWLPVSEDVCQEFVDELAVEFCQCFLGPKNHLPPYQSVVANSRFQAQCCDSLKEFVEIIGPVEVVEVRSQPMPDHASLELAMLGQLQLSLQKSIEAQDDAAGGIQELTKTFFSQHLNWLIDYCDVAASRYDSLFYCGVFNVTGQFLDSQFKQDD